MSGNQLFMILIFAVAIFKSICLSLKVPDNFQKEIGAIFDFILEKYLIIN